MKLSTKEKFGLALLVVITFIVFLPVLSSDFVNWDDRVYIYDNIAVTGFDWSNLLQSLRVVFSQKLTGIYTPLTTISFVIEHALFGLDHPEIWHFNNLLLHSVSVILVYFIARKLELSIGASFLLALLMAIHPMRVESVAWVTERKDVLYGVFYFAAILHYINHRKYRVPYQLIFIWIFFILALLVKVLAVTLPLTLLLIDYYYDGTFKKKRIVGIIPLLLFSLLFGLIGLSVASSEKFMELPEGIFGWVNNMAVSSYALGTYLVKFIYPFEMLPVYPYPQLAQWYHYLSLLLPAALLLLLFHSFFNSRKYLFFGVAFFLVNVVLSLQVVPVGQAYMADRFTYISYFGLFFLFAAYLEKFAKPFLNQKAVYVFLPILLIYGYMTFSQAQVWKNSETLWLHQLRHIPNTKSGLTNLSNYYKELGDIEKHFEYLKYSLHADSEDHATQNEMGMYYSLSNTTDHNQLALTYFNHSISLDSSYAGVFVNRAVVNGRLGYPDEALVDLNKAIFLDPTHADAWLNKAVILNSLQRYQSAIHSLDSYLEIQPNEGDKWIIKGQMHQKLNQLEEALASINRGIALSPNSGLYYFERAWCYHKLGQSDLAKQDISRGRSLGYTGQEAKEEAILSSVQQ